MLNTAFSNAWKTYVNVEMYIEMLVWERRFNFPVVRLSPNTFLSSLCDLWNSRLQILLSTTVLFSFIVQVFTFVFYAFRTYFFKPLFALRLQITVETILSVLTDIITVILEQIDRCSDDTVRRLHKKFVLLI